MRQQIIELDDRDAAMLAAIANTCGTSRVQIVRWAIRLYALRGAWTVSAEDRLDAAGGDSLIVGPHREGVA